MVGDCLQRCAPEIAFLEKQQARGLEKSLEHLVTSDFKHVTYDEAIERLIKSGKKFDSRCPGAWIYKTEHEKFLTEQTFKKPVVVTNYPKDIKAFYMRLDDDERTVAAMDVLVPGWASSSVEPNAKIAWRFLTSRMQAAGLNPDDYDHYLDLRRFGSVPHAGFGLGFERLVCLVTGTQNIRDAIPSPTYTWTLPLMDSALLPWIMLPLVGAGIGYATNWLAIKMLFHPRNPRFGLQGLLPRRQDEIAESVGVSPMIYSILKAY